MKRAWVWAMVCLVAACRASAAAPAAKSPRPKVAVSGCQEELQLRYPRLLFRSAPTHLRSQLGRDFEVLSKPRPPFMVPCGTVNLALKKPVAGSDDNPIIGRLGMVTDGVKEAAEGTWIELEPGPQWVQIDLGQPQTIYAILFWHYVTEERIYHDVIVQVSDDANFQTGVHTLFNNDRDDSSKLGKGQDREYLEQNFGKLIDARGPRGQGVKARYIRLSSNGNTSDIRNHYTEVEVYGLPDPECKFDLKFQYPHASFKGRPRSISPEQLKHMEKDPYNKWIGRQNPFYVPCGTVNVAFEKPVTSSDETPLSGTLGLVTDGKKEAAQDNWVELGPGPQWVQIDLGRPVSVYAILCWHRFDDTQTYHDVIVQASDDPDFTTGVTTIFNNDYDNSAGHGVGQDLEYFETNFGKLIDTRGPSGRGIKARYLRFTSNGNNADSMNAYFEIEVYGLPAK